MSKFLRLFSLVLALFIGVATATDFKLPMTLKFFGKQHYYEWTGTNFKSIQSDTVWIYADTTTNSIDGMDPLGFTKSAAFQYWPGSALPSDKPAEKVCVSLVLHADSDGSTVRAMPAWSQTSTGTRYNAPEDTVQLTVSGAENVQVGAAFKAPINKYFSAKFQTVTATDSAVYQRIVAYPCDD